MLIFCDTNPALRGQKAVRVMLVMLVMCCALARADYSLSLSLSLSRALWRALVLAAELAAEALLLAGEACSIR